MTTATSDRAQQISGGVFLIGFALLFLTGAWFPGIFFVIAATIVAKSIANNERTIDKGAIFLIGLGLIFWIGFNPAFFFLLLGVMVLLGCNENFSDGFSNMMEGEKPKRKRKNDEDDIFNV